MRLTVLSLLLLSSALDAQQTQPTSNLQECIDPSSFDASIDYFPDKFYPHNTTDLLTVSYHNSYKIVNNLYTKKSYVLYQCGAPIPDDIPQDDHHLFIPVPHKGGIAITETPQIPPMELLGKRSEMVAYIGDPKYVSSPCMIVNMDNDVTKLVFNPEDPRNNDWIANATRDWITENPEAIIFKGPMEAGDGNREIVLAASQERTAVATFDWLGMYGALYNLENMANRIIKETEDRYICSANNAAALSEGIPEEDRVSILWASHFSGIGWSVANCPTWDSAYYCEYAKHCGANLLSRPEGMGFYKQYGGPTKYWYVNDTEMLELGQEADHWIYSKSDWDRIYGEKKELLDQFKSVKNSRVFDTQGMGSTMWYEQRLAEYDVTALDFCDVVGNAVRDDFYDNRWFRNLKSEPIGSLPACNAPDELNEPYVPPVPTCVSINRGQESTPDNTDPADGLYGGAVKEEDKTGNDGIKKDDMKKDEEIEKEGMKKEEGTGEEDMEKKPDVESSSVLLSLEAILSIAIVLSVGLSGL